MLDIKKKSVPYITINFTCFQMRVCREYMMMVTYNVSSYTVQTCCPTVKFLWNNLHTKHTRTYKNTHEKKNEKWILFCLCVNVWFTANPIQPEIYCRSLANLSDIQWLFIIVSKIIFVGILKNHRLFTKILYTTTLKEKSLKLILASEPVTLWRQMAPWP